jgi:hypothetical protein
MIPAKVDVFFAFFSYAGNGGIACEHPSIRNWWGQTLLKIKSDERIGDIFSKEYTDTPITMTRNAAVRDARRAKADFLIMVDSDQDLDAEYLNGDPFARPFWDTSFAFAYQRRQMDMVTVVGAPYCGPPPVENVYVFRWATQQSDHPNADVKIEAYAREEAALMGGISEVAALPTGLILFDMKAFELVKPPYFYYEYTDIEETEKASTEDVTATRDISLAGQARFGYSPVYCNWDAWAGHWKPKNVRKPRLITIDQVGEKYRQAVLRGRSSREQMVIVDAFRPSLTTPSCNGG